MGSKLGVREIRVLFNDKEVYIVYDFILINFGIFKDQIDDMGFEVTLMREFFFDSEFDRLVLRQFFTRSVQNELVCQIFVIGMICQLCVKNIEINILFKLGIKIIFVLLEIEIVIVIYNFFVIFLLVIVGMIDDMGFEVIVQGSDIELVVEIVVIGV